MEEIKIGSIVSFIQDFRLYTVIDLSETVHRIKKAKIKDNETGDVINEVMFSDLKLVNE